MGTLRAPALALAAALAAAAAAAGRSAPAPSGAPEALPGYLGAARCADCHPRLHARWRGGRHSRMLQPAGPESVLGDFGRGRVALRGLEYGLRREGGAFFIRESYLEGEPRERRIDYTLGSRRVQHYLTTLPDGRVVVLPPSWDVERRQWFHNLEIVDPEETTQTRVQVWNANCVGCHVSPHERNYDPPSGTYASRWTDFGTGCERCHGPGQEHAAHHAGPAAAGAAPAAAVMVRPVQLGPERESMVCAQCHSLRDVTAPGFAAGSDYYDHFLPILEYAQKQDADPAYWDDGRPRRFSNDALGLWLSACHLRGGATCTSCHLDPHEPDIDRNPQLAPGNNGLCLGCHPALGARLEAHTRHPASSRGSSCVECHMPYTVVSLKARMRDHSIGVPAPEATRRFGIPNACTECHRDRDAAWAERALAAWGKGGAGRRVAARAEAFRGGRRGDPSALPALLDLAADEHEPPLLRANAVGHLRRYRDPRLDAALLRALRAEPAVVRAVAAMTLAELGSADAVRPGLVAALGDPRRVVRVGAAFALVSRGVTRLPGADGERLEAAKADYVRRAALLPDHAPTQLTLGQFLFLDRAYDGAAQALESALRLDAGLAGGRYFLGLARLGQRRARDARGALDAVPRGDPHYEDARRVLRSLPADR